MNAASLCHRPVPTVPWMPSLALLLALLACLLLAGCAGSSAATRFYLLSPPAGGSARVLPVAPQARVAVGPVNVASYLDRPQIVTREGDGVRLGLAEFDRWAEPLAESLPRVLAEDVSRSLGGEHVLVFPGVKADDADIRVTVDVIRLDGSLGGTVVLDAWWALLDRSGATLRRGRMVERRPAGDDYAALVTAQSGLTAALADTVAAAVREVLPRR
ncbi:PqiC family protein [Nitratidesulfovibrio sp. HK-II]|uniref:PqiC family protein n=1 Tax=Nitratidesulfovibrio sp. HK-II TaxID=2009266 RepID=UPI000EC7884C|nr:PqiC family protein [Nitratidesulfovibrio sp. HK-II]GBO96320.1 protein of unknown function DUF330 [Nitratidesulfovibrio sp. HK-II]